MHLTSHIHSNRTLTCIYLECYLSVIAGTLYSIVVCSIPKLRVLPVRYCRFHFLTLRVERGCPQREARLVREEAVEGGPDECEHVIHSGLQRDVELHHGDRDEVGVVPARLQAVEGVDVLFRDICALMVHGECEVLTLESTTRSFAYTTRHWRVGWSMTSSGRSSL